MVLRFVAGLALFLAPGAAWTWALFADLDWAKAVTLAVVLSATLPVATIYVLAIEGGVTAWDVVTACAGWTVAGLALGVGLRRRARLARL